MIINKIVMVDGVPTNVTEELSPAQAKIFNDEQVEIEKEQFYAEVNRPLDDAFKMELLVKSIPVQAKPAARPGFIWKPIYRNDSTGFGWEEVEDPYYVPDVDGTYLNPYFYTTGDSVVSGKWYTDGSDIWEATMSGIPFSFEDEAYFDIIR